MSWSQLPMGLGEDSRPLTALPHAVLSAEITLLILFPGEQLVVYFSSVFPQKSALSSSKTPGLEYLIVVYPRRMEEERGTCFWPDLILARYRGQ